ncbi:MAG TPA: C25 family cysteine peptidase, partial [Candidatus Cloacimonadota bacterium]|nr:C25 family cysteine peptidase [Candidatus Cloacimonadota bacterium]
LRTLYQRDGTYSSVGVWNSINSGANVMNHMGHANETYLLGQGLGTVQSLRNTEYGFLYSQGCYPSAFDQRTSGANESIGEHLVTAQGALFAFIGNTRYGWYMPGGIDGASQFYDRQYFIGLYEQGQTQLGKALTYSRLQNLNAALSSDVMRWCYFEVVLFGDPSIEVKFPDPNLPMLSLESYYFDDPDGDDDGLINPGELIRFYPTVRNEAGWATATNVSIRIEGVPTGVDVMGPCPMIAQIHAGDTNPSDVYIALQLPEIMGYGTFNMKVVVESAHPVTGLSTGIRTYDASFDITLLDSRFPWESPNSGKSAPLVADFNGDGSLDIMYTDIFGNIDLIGNDGLSFSSFAAPSPQNINRSSAMGQIDGLAGADLAFVSRTGNIYAQTTTGALIFDYQAPTAFIFSPMIADINGDGQNEVIAGGLDGKIYVITASGADLPGFPLHLGSTFNSELAACDLDADGAFEIICGLANGDFRVAKAGGIIDPVYSRNLNGAVTGSPVVLSNGRIAIATSQQLYLIDTDGSIVFSKPIPAQVAGGLTLADLNRNYSQDIIFVLISGEVYAVNQQGQDLYGFPVSTGAN